MCIPRLSMTLLRVRSSESRRLVTSPGGHPSCLPQRGVPKTGPPWLSVVSYRGVLRKPSVRPVEALSASGYSPVPLTPERLSDRRIGACPHAEVSPTSVHAQERGLGSRYRGTPTCVRVSEEGGQTLSEALSWTFSLIFQRFSAGARQTD